MPDSEQELACLHVDILALLFAVELHAGVAEQRRRADSTTRRLQETVVRRWVWLLCLAAGLTCLCDR